VEHANIGAHKYRSTLLLPSCGGEQAPTLEHVAGAHHRSTLLLPSCSGEQIPILEHIGGAHHRSTLLLPSCSGEQVPTLEHIAEHITGVLKSLSAPLLLVSSG
jgi:hypothetical protein